MSKEEVGRRVLVVVVVVVVVVWLLMGERWSVHLINTTGGTRTTLPKITNRTIRVSEAYDIVVLVCFQSTFKKVLIGF
ncbi:hypothetical protein M0802_012171 [Mischocyttarus mexicanus]|nr:hypothetical protein M0802_012171 [Mischocyttarus mexicanus]